MIIPVDFPTHVSYYKNRHTCRKCDEGNGKVWVKKGT